MLEHWELVRELGEQYLTFQRGLAKREMYEG